MNTSQIPKDIKRNRKISNKENRKNQNRYP